MILMLILVRKQGGDLDQDPENKQEIWTIIPCLSCSVISIILVKQGIRVGLIERHHRLELLLEPFLPFRTLFANHHNKFTLPLQMTCPDGEGHSSE